MGGANRGAFHPLIGFSPYILLDMLLGKVREDPEKAFLACSGSSEKKEQPLLKFPPNSPPLFLGGKCLNLQRKEQQKLPH